MQKDPAGRVHLQRGHRGLPVAVTKYDSVPVQTTKGEYMVSSIGPYHLLEWVGPGL